MKIKITNLLNLLTADRVLPDGCDAWAIRSVHPDFRSSRGYRWPFPGQWAEASGPFCESNAGGCPYREGDGICAATTWSGMASGGIPAITLLLVAYATTDVLGRDEYEGKFRARRMLVVGLIDGARLVREHGKDANLRDANLQDANLRDANLQGADLQGAHLQGADLRGAHLQGANLQDANLRDANLQGADLRDADLGGAHLRDADLGGANLRGAYLGGADLGGADLRGAHLRGADLRDADLRGADLRGADLRDADLGGARADARMVWPVGFTVPK